MSEMIDIDIFTHEEKEIMKNVMIDSIPGKEEAIKSKIQDILIKLYANTV